MDHEVKTPWSSSSTNSLDSTHAQQVQHCKHPPRHTPPQLTFGSGCRLCQGWLLTSEFFFFLEMIHSQWQIWRYPNLSETISAPWQPGVMCYLMICVLLDTRRCLWDQNFPFLFSFSSLPLKQSNKAASRHLAVQPGIVSFIQILRQKGSTVDERIKLKFAIYFK